MGIKITIDRDDLKELMKEAVRDVLREEKEQATSNDSNELLTQKQAAELLQVSISTIIRWKNAGDLPVQRIGKAIRYRKADVLGLKDKS